MPKRDQGAYGHGHATYGGVCSPGLIECEYPLTCVGATAETDGTCQ